MVRSVWHQGPILQSANIAYFRFDPRPRARSKAFLERNTRSQEPQHRTMNKAFSAFLSTNYPLYAERSTLSAKYLTPGAMGLLHGKRASPLLTTNNEAPQAVNESI